MLYINEKIVTNSRGKGISRRERIENIQKYFLERNDLHSNVFQELISYTHQDTMLAHKYYAW